MLVLMFDPRFKNMCLVIIFLGHENAVVIIVHGYDEKLSLPLLMEVNTC
jgi:hypothetical protein